MIVIERKNYGQSRTRLFGPLRWFLSVVTVTFEVLLIEITASDEARIRRIGAVSLLIITDHFALHKAEAGGCDTML